MTKYLTPAEAGLRLRIPSKTCSMLCARGDLPARKAGRRWVIPEWAVDELELILAKSFRGSRSIVYVIQCGADDGPLKIGVTEDLSERLRHLQLANPLPLRALVTLAGEQPLEKALHARFGALRMRGEWFEFSPEIVSFVSGLAAAVGA